VLNVGDVVGEGVSVGEQVRLNVGVFEALADCEGVDD
jgi:hypothetical protein